MTTLWHASPHLFARPDCAARIDNGHHANGGLGIFAATSPASYIAGFGRHIYEFALSESTRVLRMQVRELMFMARDPFAGTRHFFERRRLDLLGSYDAIALVESTGSVDQMIILNTDIVETSRLLSPEEFRAKSGAAARPWAA